VICLYTNVVLLLATNISILLTAKSVQLVALYRSAFGHRN